MDTTGEIGKSPGEITDYMVFLMSFYTASLITTLKLDAGEDKRAWYLLLVHTPNFPGLFCLYTSIVDDVTRNQ